RAILVDLIAARTFSDALALSLNADFLTARKSPAGDSLTWWGVGLKARFILSDMFNLAARGEIVNSKNGAYSGITPNTNVFEGTLTGVIPIKKNYEIRAEVRGDFAGDDGVFVKGATAKKNQFTGLIGFLAWLP